MARNPIWPDTRRICIPLWLSVQMVGGMAHNAKCNTTFQANNTNALLTIKFNNNLVPLNEYFNTNGPTFDVRLQFVGETQRDGILLLFHLSDLHICT